MKIDYDAIADIFFGTPASERGVWEMDHATLTQVKKLRELFYDTDPYGRSDNKLMGVPVRITEEAGIRLVRASTGVNENEKGART